MLVLADTWSQQRSDNMCFRSFLWFPCACLRPFNSLPRPSKRFNTHAKAFPKRPVPRIVQGLSWALQELSRLSKDFQTPSDPLPDLARTFQGRPTTSMGSPGPHKGLRGLSRTFQRRPQGYPSNFPTYSEVFNTLAKRLPGAAKGFH